MSRASGTADAGRPRRRLGLSVRRPTVAGAVAESGLPVDLRTHLAGLVRRTRLRRPERIAIALELADHLQSMLDDGIEPADAWSRLVSDPQVATLLRRSTRRLRPWPYVVLKSLLLGTAALVLLYGGLAAYHWSGSPRPSVNYVARLNEQAAAVPDEVAAWPLYRATMPAFRDGEPDFADLIEGAPAHPGETGWDRYDAWLDAAGPATIEHLREAAHRPGLGFEAGFGFRPEDEPVFGPYVDGVPVLENPTADWRERSMFEVQLPYLTVLRDAARVLWIDALRAADDGDHERALDDLEAIAGTAEHAVEVPVLIGELVRVAIHGLAVDAAGVIVDRHASELDLASLDRLARLLDDVPAGLDARALDAERWSFDDFMQRLYTDDGDGDGRVTAEGLRFFRELVGGTGDGLLDGATRGGVGSALALPAVNAVVASRREMAARADELFALAEADWERSWHEPAGDSVSDRVVAMQSDPLDRVRYAPLVMLMPALSQAQRSSVHLRAEADAVRIAIAVERHRRRTGGPPADAAALVPEDLASMPPDPFAPAPLRLRIGPDGLRVWSIGADRDDDDGAAPARGLRRLRDVARPTPSPPDGDWILWPPDARDD